jgi:hypothetical protein
VSLGLEGNQCSQRLKCKISETTLEGGSGYDDTDEMDVLSKTGRYFSSKENSWPVIDNTSAHEFGRFKQLGYGPSHTYFSARP